MQEGECLVEAGRGNVRAVFFLVGASARARERNLVLSAALGGKMLVLGGDASRFPELAIRVVEQLHALLQLVDVHIVAGRYSAGGCVHEFHCACI